MALSALATHRLCRLLERPTPGIWTSRDLSLPPENMELIITIQCPVPGMLKRVNAFSFDKRTMD